MSFIGLANGHIATDSADLEDSSVAIAARIKNMTRSALVLLEPTARL